MSEKKPLSREEMYLLLQEEMPQEEIDRLKEAAMAAGRRFRKLAE